MWHLRDESLFNASLSLWSKWNVDITPPHWQWWLCIFIWKEEVYRYYNLFSLVLMNLGFVRTHCGRCMWCRTFFWLFIFKHIDLSMNLIIGASTLLLSRISLYICYSSVRVFLSLFCFVYHLLKHHGNGLSLLSVSTQLKPWLFDLFLLAFLSKWQCPSCILSWFFFFYLKVYCILYCSGAKDEFLRINYFPFLYTTLKTGSATSIHGTYIYRNARL
jgi:hypothetical protein